MARRKKKTVEDAWRERWQLTSEQRQPLTFIERPVRTKLSPFRGTAVDDVLSIVRFTRAHGNAPKIVQQAAQRIFTPSQLLLVLAWLSEIRSELPDDVLEIAGCLSPDSGALTYFVWDSQYAEHRRQPQLKHVA